MSVTGLWCLKGSEPPLWTARAADIIKNKKTGKEYMRGEMKLFKDADIPQKIEDNPDEWEFIYLRNGKPVVDKDEYVRDIWVNSMFRK